jgi:hypothetical protein
MPKVGMKEFSYGPKGMKAAKMEAKKTGKKMVVKPSMKKMGKRSNGKLHRRTPLLQSTQHLISNTKVR